MSPRLIRFAADATIVVHAAFVVFVLFGGFLAVRWRRLVWIHLPSVIWGVVVEWAGWICPLTPLENYLREHGGEPVYRGDFIEHYLVPLLYPSNLTPQTQFLLGAAVIAINAAAYALVGRRRQRGR